MPSRFLRPNILTTADTLKCPLAAELKATSKLSSVISNTPPRPNLREQTTAERARHAVLKLRRLM